MGQFDFVRMALMPKIRPLGTDQSAFQDDPEQGTASIGGTGGGVIDLNFSMSHSVNRQHNDENQRTFDKVKIFSSKDKASRRTSRSTGDVDRSSYIEMEIMRKVEFDDGAKATYARPQIKDNMELVAEGLTRKNT